MKIDAFHYIQLGTVYRYLCTVLLQATDLDIIKCVIYSWCNHSTFQATHLTAFLWFIITFRRLHMLQKHSMNSILVWAFDILCFFYRGLHSVPDEEVIAMYEGCHVPLEIMSDFYGKVMIISSLTYDKRDTTGIKTPGYNDVDPCPAEFPWPHHEAVHGHILPAWDDPPVLCQWLLHEAQYRLWASPSLQRRKGELSCYYSAIFDQCFGKLSIQYVQ